MRNVLSNTQTEAVCSVAVVIPVFNGERFIRRALDSVLEQTHPAAEIFVVDDGSKDGTLALVEDEYRDKVTILSQSNGGPAKARNAAMRLVKSHFIAFLDADDWWEPAKLEKQVQSLRLNSGCVMNYTGLLLVNEVGGDISKRPPVDPAKLWPGLRLGNPSIPPSCVMVRRDAALRVGGFNERQVGSEDWCLWFQLIALGNFCVCREMLTNYRVSPGGLSGDADHMFKDGMKMLDDVLLQGLSGWRRALWRRRIISYQAYKAVLTARAAGQTDLERKYMKKSLITWPSLFWVPQRFKAFAVTLLRSR